VECEPVLPALLRGKLSEQQENLEDILTSTVFGLLQYIPIQIGLLKFISCAVPFRTLITKPLPQFASKVKYEFWPWLQNDDCYGAEPDVLIRVTDNVGIEHLILVEAKFHSGKSSTAESTNHIPTDQLAKEWDNLVRQSESEDAIPHLIYLTADYGVPVDALEDSAKEFQSKRPEKNSQYPFECYWLSWRHLAVAFKGASDPMLRDLIDLTRRYGFAFFDGITPIVAKHIEWKFSLPQDLATKTYFSFGPFSTARPSWSFKK
jgi:hypothetical protein